MFHMFYMLGSLFNKVSGPQPCNFISKRRRWFAVKLAKSLRAPILKNNCERLLLFSKNFANFRGKLLCQSLYLIRSQAWRPTLLLKTNSPAQVFPCEFCEIFKNTAAVAASKTLYRTTQFWNQRPIHFLKTKNTMLNFINLTQ